MYEPYDNHNVPYEEIRAYCRWCRKETNFIIAKACYCHVDFDGCGYTYQDEHGDCDVCMEEPATCAECQGSYSLSEIEKE
jgi:hypothetical protein